MTTDEIELKALMLASQEGDAAAHRVLLGRLSSRLRAYYKGKLARIGKAAAEAEDLVQEAVLAIHLKRGTYDPGEPLMPWVYAIARYKLIDFLRRSRASHADVPIEEADEVVAHDDHDAAESSYDIRRLMERLTKNMRCAIEAVEEYLVPVSLIGQRRRIDVRGGPHHAPPHEICVGLYCQLARLI